MGRPRHQDGWVEETGSGVKRWKGHWYIYTRGEDGRERRAHRSLVLGIKRCGNTADGCPAQLGIRDARLPVLTKTEAERELRKLIAQTVGPDGETIKQDSRVTFGWFWRHKWLPLRRGKWRASTRAINEHVLEHHIGDRWDAAALSEIQPEDVAEWLDGLAGRYSHSMVSKCRNYLKAILQEAVEQEYLRKNPMRRVSLPETREEASGFHAWPEVAAIRTQFKRERDRLIFDLFVCLGLRPGELFALRWGDVRPSALLVDEAVVEGKVGKTKTRGSKSAVALPAVLAARIEAWRPDRAMAEDWLFPSATGKPIRRRSWHRHSLQPAAAAAGLKTNYQMLRRTFATLANDAGVPAKLIQAQLRHASMQTTADVYMQVVDASQQKAIEQFASKLFDAESEKNVP